MVYGIIYLWHFVSVQERSATRFAGIGLSAGQWQFSLIGGGDYDRTCDT